MLRHRKKTFVLTFGPIVAGFVLYAGFMQSTDERLVDLEDRVLRLEATVSVLAQASQPVPTEQTAALHTITGVYLERPEQITGSECNTFYPTGTTVFLSDWDGQVLGTSELGDGVLGATSIAAFPAARMSSPSNNCKKVTGSWKCVPATASSGIQAQRGPCMRAVCPYILTCIRNASYTTSNPPCSFGNRVRATGDGGPLFYLGGS
jgi:hypothetical protein